MSGKASEGEQKSSQKASEKKSGRVRKLAEWVTMGISLVLILVIAGFLVYEGMQSKGPEIEVEARLLHGETKRVGERYILPVEVTNKGDHALTELKVEVSYTSKEGKEETKELEITYLGERSSQKAYLYFDDDPRTLKPEAKPQFYFLD